MFTLSSSPLLTFVFNLMSEETIENKVINQEDSSLDTQIPAPDVASSSTKTEKS
jgi:hypothetical protein